MLKAICFISILLLSLSAFSADKTTDELLKDIQAGNLGETRRTETLFETLMNSTREQELSQYAYTISGGMASVKGLNTKGESVRYLQPGLQIGFRAFKNVWIEGAFYQSVETDFPALGLDTKIQTFSLRGKFNLELSSALHLQPYLGVFRVTADSPGAGVSQDGTITTAELEAESALIDELYKTRVAAGITLMTKVWQEYTTRVDFGTDIFSINVGRLF